TPSVAGPRPRWTCSARAPGWWRWWVPSVPCCGACLAGSWAGRPTIGPCPPASSACRDRHAAVGHDHRAHHEAGALRGEKGHHLGDLLRLRGATDGGGLAVLGEESGAVVHNIVEDIGDHVADADGVDADAMLDRLQCQG